MLRAPIDAALVRPARRASGSVQVPGDKSISHRYALFGAIADGATHISGYSSGADCAATLGCLRALGVRRCAFFGGSSGRCAAALPEQAGITRSDAATGCQARDKHPENRKPNALPD